MVSNTAGPASQRLHRADWRVLPLLMAFAFLCHFNRVGMSVVGTERLIKADVADESSGSASSEDPESSTTASKVSQQFDENSKEHLFSPDEMGLVYSAYLFVYTLMMIPGGWLIDRAGPCAALALMGFGSAGLVVLTGLPAWGPVPVAAALPIFIVIRGALGFFTTPLHPGAARMISITMAPAIQSWANGMVVGAAVFGIASTYYLVGMLMDAIGWPGVFLVSGLATLAVTTLWWVAIPREPVAASPAGPSPNGPGETAGASPIPASDGAGVQTGLRRFLSEMIPLFRNRSLMLVTISYGAFGYFQYLFFYWMQYYFDDTLKMSKEDSRLSATIPTLAMALGMIAGGFLSDRLQRAWGLRRGRAAVPMAGMLGAAVFALIGVNLVDPVSVVICFSVAMGLLGMSEGPYWSTAVDLGGRRGGMAAAIFNTGGNVGGTLAPYLTPRIGTHFGWEYAIGLACLFCLVGAVLWFWIIPSDAEAES